MAAPVAADDATRAVIAASLLRERRIVLGRLRGMGVDVIEAPWPELGPALARMLQVQGLVLQRDAEIHLLGLRPQLRL